MLKNINNKFLKVGALVTCATLLIPLASCSEKKKSDEDISVVSKDTVYYASREIEAHRVEGSSNSYLQQMTTYKDGMAALINADFYSDDLEDDGSFSDMTGGGNVGIARDVTFDSFTPDADSVKTELPKVRLLANGTGSDGADTGADSGADTALTTIQIDPIDENLPVDDENMSLPEGEGWEYEDIPVTFPPDYSGYSSNFFLAFFDKDMNLINEISLTDIAGEDEVLGIFTGTDDVLYLAVAPFSPDWNSTEIWVFGIDDTGAVVEDKKVFKSKYLEDFKSSGSEIGCGLNQIAAGADGYWYVMGNTSSGDRYSNIFSVFDNDGEELFTLEDEQNSPTGFAFQGMLVLGEDAYLAGYNFSDSLGDWIAKIDVEKKDIGEKQADISIINHIYQLQIGKDGIFYSDDRGVFEADLEKENPNPLLLWKDQDFSIGQYTPTTYVLSRDQIFLITDEHDNSTEKSASRWYMLERQDQNPNAGKKILRIGGFGIETDPNIKKMIYDYNQSSAEFRAEIKDYYDMNANYDEKAYRDAVNAMNMDMISGQMPDIIIGNPVDVNFNLLARKGQLSDMYSLMEEDTEITTDKFFPNILQTLETDGKLYYMTDSFHIETLIGRKSLVGERSTWTWEEFQAFADSLPDGVAVLEDFYQGNLLRYALSTSLPFYMDIEEGTTNFDSQDFINLLQYCEKFGKSEEELENQLSWKDPDEQLRNNEIALKIASIYNMDSFTYNWNLLGDPVSFMAYPSDYSTGLSFSSYRYFAVSEHSENKKEAWDLSKILLSEEYQERLDEVFIGFPVRMEAFDKAIEKAKQLKDQQNNWDWGLGMSTQPLPQDGADAVREIVEGITTMGMYDDGVMGIIEEESAAFFSGSKSAEQVVKVIQDRVQTLLNERG